MKNKLAILTVACIGVTSFTASTYALSQGDKLMRVQIERVSPHIDKTLKGIQERINIEDGNDDCVYADALSADNTKAADYISSTLTSTGCVTKFTFNSDDEIAVPLRDLALVYTPTSGAKKLAWSKGNGKLINGYECHIIPGSNSPLAVVDALGTSVNKIMRHTNKSEDVPEVVGDCVVDSGFSAPTYLTA